MISLNKNQGLLDTTAQKVYDMPASAKSGVGLGSLKCYGVQYATCVMSGFFVPICTHAYLYGGACGDSVSCADTVESVCQPHAFRHPKLGSFGGGLTQNLSTELP